MKIKLSDVNKMIKEEFERTLAKKKLSSRLSQINEELKNMNSEDSILNEVEAGGKTTVSSNAWTGKPNGDVKWDAKFQKKGSHLMEDDEEEENEMGGEKPEMGGAPEMGGEEEMEIPMGEFEAKFAEIGRAIDAKMGAEMGAGMAPEMGGEPEMGGAPEMGEPEMGGAEGGDEDFEEVEVSDDNDEVEETVHESVDEPLEGHSVAQEVAADTMNDNMEKDTHVKEGATKKGAVITEVKKPAAKNIFTEGLDAKKKTALLEEFNRMKKFAGLSKDEE